MSLFLLLWILAVNCQSATAETVRVSGILSGDTFKVGKKQYVRLRGVDAPQNGQQFSRHARFYLRDYIDKRTVKISNCARKRSYFRVCTVHYKNRDISREVLGYGWGFLLPREAVGKNYEMAVTFAQRQHRGLWQLPNGGIRPWAWRKYMIKH